MDTFPLVVCGFVATFAAAKVGYGVGKKMMVPMGLDSDHIQDMKVDPAGLLDHRMDNEDQVAANERIRNIGEDVVPSGSTEVAPSPPRSPTPPPLNTRKRSRDDVDQDDEDDTHSNRNSSPTPLAAKKGYPFNLSFIYPYRKKRRTLDVPVQPSETVVPLIEDDRWVLIGQEEGGKEEDTMIDSQIRENGETKLLDDNFAVNRTSSPEPTTSLFDIEHLSDSPGPDRPNPNEVELTQTQAPSPPVLVSASPSADDLEEVTIPVHIPTRPSSETHCTRSTDAKKPNILSGNLTSIAPTSPVASPTSTSTPKPKPFSAGFASFAGQTSSGFGFGTIAGRSSLGNSGTSRGWLHQDKSQTEESSSSCTPFLSPTRQSSHAISQYNAESSPNNPIGPTLSSHSTPDLELESSQTLLTLHNIKLYIKRSTRGSFNASPIVGRLKLLKDEEGGIRMLIRREPLLQPIMNVHAKHSGTKLGWDKDDGVLRVIVLGKEDEAGDKDDLVVYAIRPSRKDRKESLQEFVDMLGKECGIVLG